MKKESEKTNVTRPARSAKKQEHSAPIPAKNEAAALPRAFVVKKHDATHLHYDFRLGDNGSLLSWALPVGPSYWPGHQREAIRVANQKRDDALAMLRAMRKFLATDPGPKQVNFHFEHSKHWEALRHWAGDAAEERRGPGAAVLNELRRDPAAWKRERAAALGWWLAAERTRREGYSMDAMSVLAQSGEFCAAHGIQNAEGLDQWLASNHCNRGDLESILETSGYATRLEAHAQADLDSVLLDFLRWSGSYAELLRKAGAN